MLSEISVRRTFLRLSRSFKKLIKYLMRRRGPNMSLLTDTFIQQRHLAKCMMRSNNLNWPGHGGYTGMTSLFLNVNATDKDGSKRIIVHEDLSKNCSTDVSKSKRNIVNKTLSQNNSADVSENTITEQKKEEHKEPSVTKEVTSYFNIYECGRNILVILDVMYQQSTIPYIMSRISTQTQ